MKTLTDHPTAWRDFLFLLGEEALYDEAGETTAHFVRADSERPAVWGHSVDGETHIWVATPADMFSGLANCPACPPGADPIRLDEVDNPWGDFAVQSDVPEMDPDEADRLFNEIMSMDAFYEGFDHSLGVADEDDTEDE